MRSYVNVTAEVSISDVLDDIDDDDLEEYLKKRNKTAPVPCLFLAVDQLVDAYARGEPIDALLVKIAREQCGRFIVEH